MAQLSESELEVITAHPLKDELNTFCSSQSKFPNQQYVDAGKVTELLVLDNVNAGKEVSPNITSLSVQVEHIWYLISF